MKRMMEIKNFDIGAVKDELRGHLDSFSEDIYHALPELPAHGFTQLDKLMREHRVDRLMTIRKDCDNLRNNLDDRPLPEVVVEIEEFITCLKSMANEVNQTVTVKFMHWVHCMCTCTTTSIDSESCNF